LAICDVDEAGLAETATMAHAAGVEVFADRVDVADLQEMEAFARSVHERHDAVDLLVNNAGVAVVGDFLETTPRDWDRVLSVNVLGVVHGCYAFLPAMIGRGHGYVVNVASAVAFMPTPTMSAYSASKAAVLAFSETLRAELRPLGIGVSAVCPGLINSPTTSTVEIRGDNANERRARMMKVYKRRDYTPARVARHILRGVKGDRPVVPVAVEAYAMYGLSRVPPLARWVASRAADMTS
jgi:short-subunit dehydrogenase